MLANQLNLNQLKVFISVVKNKSMTKAASELHLTQSGVSQHIKSLEDVLGLKLFDRIKQKIVPTREAVILFESCSNALGNLEQALVTLKGGEEHLSGKINIGMPIEFGNNVIVPLITEWGKERPMVRFVLKYEFATAINEALISGALDFAFVDDFGMDRRIHHEPIFDEILVLCGPPQIAKKVKSLKAGTKYRHEREWFESLSYVDYQPGEPVLRRWFEHHLGHRGLKLDVRATVMDVQAVARFIYEGMGCGVLPEYLVGRMAKQGHELYVFQGSGKPLKNRISLATLPGRTQSSAVRAIVPWLKSELKKITT